MSQRIWNSFACNLSISIYSLSISVFWSKTTIYRQADWKNPIQGYQYFHHISRYNFGSFLRKVRCCPFLSFSTLYYREKLYYTANYSWAKVKTKNWRFHCNWNMDEISKFVCISDNCWSNSWPSGFWILIHWLISAKNFLDDKTFWIAWGHHEIPNFGENDKSWKVTKLMQQSEEWVIFFSNFVAVSLCLQL